MARPLSLKMLRQLEELRQVIGAHNYVCLQSQGYFEFEAGGRRFALGRRYETVGVAVQKGSRWQRLCVAPTPRGDLRWPDRLAILYRWATLRPDDFLYRAIHFDTLSSVEDALSGARGGERPCQGQLR